MLSLSALSLELARPGYAAAGALAAAAVLVLSARRGRASETAYLDVWERALAQSPLWVRLAQWAPGLRALLLAIAAAFALLAAAGPVRRLPGPADVVFVVDRSATMAASEEGRPRIEAAKAWVAGELARRGADDRIGLAAAGRELEALVAPTTDRARLAAALAAIEVEPVASDLRAPLAALAGSGVPWILATDAAGAKAASLRAARDARIHRVGGPAANAGIVDLAVDDPFPEPEARIAVTVRNASREAARVDVAVDGASGEVARAALDAPAGAERTVRLDVPRGDGGSFRVRLDPGDAFALDDAATFLLESPARAPVVWVESRDASALVEAAAGALALELRAPLGRTADAADAPPEAVIVQEGGSLARLPARAILFGVEAPGISEARRGDERAEVTRVDGAHPLVRGLLLDGLLARPRVRLAPGGAPLVEGAGGTLVAAYARPGSRVFATAFTLSESNLAVVEAAFPVLVRRAFAWVARDEPGVVAAVRTGDDPSAALDGAPRRGPGRLGPWTLPDGRRTTASLLDAAAADPSAGAAAPGPPLPDPAAVLEPLGRHCVAASLAAIVLYGLLGLPAAWAGSAFSRGREGSSVARFHSSPSPIDAP